MAKPGGRILLIAECAEGIGSVEFARMLDELQSFETFLEDLQQSAVKVDQWQLERLALTALKHDLFFYTPGVTQEQLGCLGSRAFADLSDAVTAALEGLPTGARIALVPDGPYTFARAEATVGITR
jgi:nickel-dependent lactate racemase